MAALSQSQVRQKPRLVFLVTEYYFFHAMRKDLASAATCEAFDVHVIAFCGASGALARDGGFQVTDFPWRRSNSLLQAALQFLPELNRVKRILRALRPDILHNIAMKPAIIGTLAAPRGTRIVNTLTGFGFLFYARSLGARIAQTICAAVLRRASFDTKARLVVHNMVDGRFARERLGIPAADVRLIRGLGIDTNHFALLPQPIEDAPFRFLVITRLLYMKGVQVVIAAYQALLQRGIAAELHLCGAPDPENPSSIPEDVLKSWASLPGVRFLGQVPDVRVEIAACHAVVHAALGGEGLPRVLLEGSACGRALIATDVSGNSDIVVPGETGLMVAPDDVTALAQAMEWMTAHPADRLRFGAAGRARVVAEFASEHIAAGYDDLYRDLESTQ
jgi:glycosyltransferase involved in cell wall biosynthesis